MEASDTSDVLRRLLKGWNAVQNGKVHQSKVSELMTKLNSGMTDAQLNDMFVASDSNADGLISVDKFLDWLLSVKGTAGTVTATPSTLTSSAPTTSLATSSSAQVQSASCPETNGQNTHQAVLIDGKAIADSVLAAVKAEVNAIQNAKPNLVVIMVGENPASATYVRRKEEAAKTCGIETRKVSFSSEISQEQLLQEVKRLNEDDGVHGIIVQLPLPSHIDAATVTGAVAEGKDVDGFTPANIGSVALNGYAPLFCPCTPKGCLHLLKSVGVPLRGKEAVVVGASNIVGIPMSLLLLKEGCTTSVCHIDTVDVAAHTRKADILVVAVGKAGLVRGDWIKPGAIVIDVGINFVADASKKTGKRMVGDVEFDEARSVADYITPVPGGVGPMTVAMLMQNTMDAMKRSLIK
eukprot:gnl/MRDRNA2_/MRDRNA2_108334_c0_seq1.p1 gnl/MRDRNA2_/MRDRNA2_108334_c0~~gnl/MRDRNA2_/MRDRNA2_108334_c0_seq1.p1  ORF type:complete len:408 (+),score=82.81 gnl/MRDRNA2_/MRDRNA2_108334_c0_seq1:99-1322(+)